MTHDEVREMLAALSLDALGKPEEQVVGEHLDGCAECRHELQRCHEVAGALAMLAEARRPPPGLRGRVLAGIGPSEAPPVKGHLPPSTPPVKGHLPPSTPPVKGHLRPAQPIPKVAIWHRLVGRNGVGLRSHHRFRARLASGEPGARLNAIEKGSAILATIYVAADGGSGWLAATHMPDPGDAVYQVWAILDGRPVGVAAFRPDRNGRALVRISRGLGAASPGALTAVTLENRAGNPTPRGAMVVSGSTCP